MTAPRMRGRCVDDESARRSETLALTGNGTMADPNVGTLKPLTLGTLALGDRSGLASNYTPTAARTRSA